jgi:hypothetical protein
MAFTFPASPATNDTYTVGPRTYTWSGYVWEMTGGLITSIVTDQITDLAVTTAKIANTAVTTAKIANTAVTATQIANATITATQIANTTITATQIANATITATQIANTTITNTQLAANVAATNLGFTPASTGKAIAMAVVFG